MLSGRLPQKLTRKQPRNVLQSLHKNSSLLPLTKHTTTTTTNTAPNLSSFKSPYSPIRSDPTLHNRCSPSLLSSGSSIQATNQHQNFAQFSPHLQKRFDGTKISSKYDIQRESRLRKARFTAFLQSPRGFAKMYIAGFKEHAYKRGKELLHYQPAILASANDYIIKLQQQLQIIHKNGQSNLPPRYLFKKGLDSIKNYPLQSIIRQKYRPASFASIKKTFQKFHNIFYRFAVLLPLFPMYQIYVRGYIGPYTPVTNYPNSPNNFSVTPSFPHIKFQTPYLRFPRMGDEILVNYIARLDDGTIIDSSERRGHPVTIKVGRQRDVPPGFDKALMLVPIGQRGHATVPFDEAYGARGIPGVVPPYATVFYDIEMLKINNKTREELLLLKSLYDNPQLAVNEQSLFIIAQNPQVIDKKTWKEGLWAGIDAEENAPSQLGLGPYTRPRTSAYPIARTGFDLYKNLYDQLERNIEAQVIPLDQNEYKDVPIASLNSSIPHLKNKDGEYYENGAVIAYRATEPRFNEAFYQRWVQQAQSSTKKLRARGLITQLLHHHDPRDKLIMWQEIEKDPTRIPYYPLMYSLDDPTHREFGDIIAFDKQGLPVFYADFNADDARAEKNRVAIFNQHLLHRDARLGLANERKVLPQLQDQTEPQDPPAMEPPHRFKDVKTGFKHQLKKYFAATEFTPIPLSESGLTQEVIDNNNFENRQIYSSFLLRDQFDAMKYSKLISLARGMDKYRKLHAHDGKIWRAVQYVPNSWLEGTLLDNVVQGESPPISVVRFYEWALLHPQISFNQINRFTIHLLNDKGSYEEWRERAFIAMFDEDDNYDLEQKMNPVFGKGNKTDFSVLEYPDLGSTVVHEPTDDTFVGAPQFFDDPDEDVLLEEDYVLQDANLFWDWRYNPKLRDQNNGLMWKLLFQNEPFMDGKDYYEGVKTIRPETRHSSRWTSLSNMPFYLQFQRTPERMFSELLKATHSYNLDSKRYRRNYGFLPFPWQMNDHEIRNIPRKKMRGKPMAFSSLARRIIAYAQHDPKLNPLGESFTTNPALTFTPDPRQGQSPYPSYYPNQPPPQTFKDVFKDRITERDTAYVDVAVHRTATAQNSWKQIWNLLNEERYEWADDFLRDPDTIYDTIPSEGTTWLGLSTNKSNPSQRAPALSQVFSAIPNFEDPDDTDLVQHLFDTYAAPFLESANERFTENPKFFGNQMTAPYAEEMRYQQRLLWPSLAKNQTEEVANMYLRLRYTPEEISLLNDGLDEGDEDDDDDDNSSNKVSLS